MNKNFNPLVTVYIPTYNRLDLLKRALASVQQQTYSHLEIIVVDDCSTDGTQEFLIQAAKEDKRIRYIFKEANSGACVSRNLAIKQATGEFITGLDDDDYFLPNRIEVFVKAAKKNPDAAYYTYYKVKINNVKIKFPLSFLLRSRVIKTYRKLLIQNYVGNQIFIRTEVLKSSDGFDESIKIWQDYEYWLRLSKFHHLRFVIIRKVTQIVDISHAGERISINKVNYAINSYKKICQKLNLDKKESFILRGGQFTYFSENPSLKLICIYLYKTKSIFWLRILVKQLYSKFKISI